MTPNDQTPTGPQRPATPGSLRMFGGNLQARYQGLSTRNRLLIAGGAVLTIVILFCCSCSLLSSLASKGGATTAGHQTTSAPAGNQTKAPTATKAPTKPAATATPIGPVLKLSGNGTKTSPTFHVNGQWEIVYHCDNSTSLQTVPFYINVYNSDGTTTFDSVSADCPKGGLSDETIIHEGGDKYLKILAMSPWSLQVIDIL